MLVIDQRNEPSTRIVVCVQTMLSDIISDVLNHLMVKLQNVKFTCPITFNCVLLFCLF